MGKRLRRAACAEQSGSFGGEVIELVEFSVISEVDDMLALVVGDVEVEELLLSS